MKWGEMGLPVRKPRCQSALPAGRQASGQACGGHIKRTWGLIPHVSLPVKRVGIFYRVYLIMLSAICISAGEVDFAVMFILYFPSSQAILLQGSSALHNPASTVIFLPLKG